MDVKALFKLTYGMYIVGVNKDEKNYGCVINTVAQGTAEPVRVLVTMQKSNKTTEVISESGSFTVSVLSANTPMEIISTFGNESSRTIDKFINIDYAFDLNHNPYIMNGVIAKLSLRVSDTIDLDTHLLFICDVDDAEVISKSTPMTYDDYRNLKNGNNEDEANKIWTCAVCHYVYDGEIPFEDLPDDYICPICKKPKNVFFAD